MNEEQSVKEVLLDQLDTIKVEFLKVRQSFLYLKGPEQS